MNVFILARSPKVIAMYHVDKHVVKMPLETAQMLCAVLHKSGMSKKDKNKIPYKATHLNHPCTIWAYESRENFNYLYDIGIALCREYTYRYGKKHKCEAVIRECKRLSRNIKFSTRIDTPPAQAMPDEYKSSNVITAYRAYYVGEKSHLFKWTGRPTPKFIDN